MDSEVGENKSKYLELNKSHEPMEFLLESLISFFTGLIFNLMKDSEKDGKTTTKRIHTEIYL